MVPVHILARIRDTLVASCIGFMMLAPGCSRQMDVPTDEPGTQTDQAPFRPVASNPADSLSSPAIADDDIRENRLPFHDSQNLPAGTLLTVRLSAPISGEPESFEGKLDEPVISRGKTVIPGGTLVSGRVESESSPTIKPERAYVRLMLTSIQLSGSKVPLRTASLFVRQHIPNGFSSDEIIRLEKGHRLTFRLAEPLSAPAQTAQVTH